MLKEEYLNLIDTYKADYIADYQKLLTLYKRVLFNYNTEAMKSIMYQHKLLVVETINKILKHFPELNDVSNMVLLTGSFARNTNLLFSDIDINFIYNNIYRDRYLEIEDKIEYMMSQIFGFRGRDQIHGITYYLPKISNNYNFEIHNNCYELHFEDGNIYYQCRENAYDTMWNTLNSTRSTEDLTNYMVNHLQLFQNWTHCYELIHDNGYYEDFHKQIKLFEKNSIHDYDYEMIKDKLLNDLNYEKGFEENSIKISELKHVVKEKELSLLYNFITYVYRMAIRKGCNLENVDLKNIYESKLFQQMGLDDSIFNNIYYYLNLIVKLQYTLNEHNLDLSKHSLKIIPKDDLNYYYKECFNGNNILTELFEERRIINSNVKSILRKLK